MSTAPTTAPSGPDDLDKLVATLNANLAAMDFTETIDGIAEDLTKTHEGFFNDQADPSGSPWKPLAPVTVKRKGHPVILIEHNNMRSSVVHRQHGKHVERITPRSLDFGTDDEKAAFHQEGTEHVPQREFVGWDERAIESAENKIADAALDQLLQGI